MNTSVRRLTLALAATVAVLATSVANASSIGPVASTTLNGNTGTAVSGAPTVYASDNFTGTTGSTLNGRILTLGGGTWSVAAGTWTINATNEAQITGVALGRAITVTGRPNARIIATVFDGGTNARTSGVVLRSSNNALTFLSAYTQSGSSNRLHIARRQGGTSTILVTVSGIIFTNPATFAVELNGANIIVSYNGTVVINYTLTAADQTTFGSLGGHGLLNDNAGTIRYDNFRVESL